MGGSEVATPLSKGQVVLPPAQPELTHEVIPQFVDTAKNRGGDVIAATAVAVDLPGVYESLWLGTAVAAYQTRDPLLAASLLTGLTAVAEGGAALGASRLLATERGSKVMAVVNKGLGRLGLKEGVETNLAVDTAVAFVASTPVMLTAKQAMDPSRTKEQNRRRGLLTAAIVTALTAPVNYAVAEGITSVIPEKVGIGTLAIASLIAIRSYITQRLKGSGEEYNRWLNGATPGPQIEGLIQHELDRAKEDKKLETIDLTDNLRNKKITLPFAVPIEYASWLYPDFIEKQGYDPDKTLYCTLPQSVLSKFSQDEILQKLSELQAKGFEAVLVDYPEYVSPPMLSSAPEEAIDNLITEAGTPAAIYHYKGCCEVDISKVAEYRPSPNVRSLSSDEIDEHFERIWQIYESRFQDLIDDHPINGMIPKDVLRETLKNDATRIMAYFEDSDDGDKMVAFGYICDDIRLCTWLNPSYFQKESQGLPLVYMPGIASAKDAKSPVATQLMNAILKQTSELHGDKFMLTFECSNRSAQYIPKLVKRAFNQSGMVRLDNLEELKHYYKILKLQ